MKALYKVKWKQSAKKELKKLGKVAIPRIINAVESLSLDPYPAGSRKLYGAEHLYRLRVGDYRVIYSVEGKVLLIEIIRIGYRRDIYRKFI